MKTRIKIFSSIFIFVCYFSILNLWAKWNISYSTAGADVYVDYNISLAVDKNNVPHIAYTSYSQGNLFYAKKTGNEWSIYQVDGPSSAGRFVSIALDSNNYPYIAYSSLEDGDLKFAQWDGTKWSTSTVDSFGTVGKYLSLAIDSKNIPHIAYFRQIGESLQDPSELKYAKWTGTSWSTQTVKYLEKMGQSASIAIDSQDNPHIVYYDLEINKLKYARLINNSLWQIKIVSAGVEYIGGEYASMALDSQNYPHIAYLDKTDGINRLKYAKLNNWEDFTWSTQTVDIDSIIDFGLSLKLDSKDNPHIIYYDINYRVLKYAKNLGSFWDIQMPDYVPNMDIGKYSSIAINNEDIHIAHFDYTRKTIRYLHMWWTPDPPQEDNRIFIYHPIFYPDKNEKATIKYEITNETKVKITVYDFLRRKIKTLLNERYEPGSYSIQWDGKDETGDTVSSGSYIIFFETKTGKVFKKVVVIR